MKITVNTKEISEALQRCAVAIDNRPAMPILDCVKITAAKDKIELVSTNLNVWIKCVISDVKITEEGECCLPIKLLSDTVKTISHNEITIDANKVRGELTCGDTRCVMAAMDSADYPKMSIQDSKHIGTVDFSKALPLLYTVTEDDINTKVNGLYFDGANFVACTSHRIVVYSSGADIEGVSLRIPKKVVGIIKSFKESDYNANVFLCGESASICIGSYKIFFKQHDGNFVNYKQFFMAGFNHSLTIKKDLLKNVLNRVLLFSGDTNVARFHLGLNVNIVSEDADYGKDMSSVVDAEYIGDDMLIGLNAKMLLEMVNNMESDTVIMRFSSENKQIMIYQEGIDGWKAILMQVIVK